MTSIARPGPAVRLVVNVVAFQAAWFACVMLAAQGRAVLSTLAACGAILLHFAWSERRGADVKLIGVALAIGVVWDTAMAASGLIDYAAPWPIAGAAPLWILALWAQFATALREPLRWLHDRPFLAAAFGGIGGPLSYAAAARLGACRFDDPALALAVLGAGWAIATPVLVQLARRLDREGPTT